MNFKKKMRRGSLAALITLALTSSALAMPTGGEVVRGAGDITLSDGTWGNVANNATITATNDGQINWQAFNIANGETLNFDIANNKTLVNQVTGDQLSSILGTMNQTGTGKGNVVLINPNGIYVGTTAVLNISDLTLSALKADDASETHRLLTAGGEGLVNVTGGHFTANEVNLIGRKVTVADGVVFDLGTAGDTSTKTMLQVLAADRAEWTFAGDKMLTKNITHNAGNDVVFNGKVTMKGGRDNYVDIGGATASATGAKFHDLRLSGNRIETTIYAASKMSADERSENRKDRRYYGEATAANTVVADDIQADGESFSLGGGVATLKNSSISVDDLAIDGISSVTTRGDGKRMETLTAPDRTVNIEDSTLTANEVTIRGGKVTVANNVTFSAEDPAHEDGLDIVAGSEQVSSDGKTRTYTMGKGNDLAFHGKVENFGKKEKDPVAILGSKVNLDGALIEGARYVNAAAAQCIVSTEGANGGARVTASAGNALSADGAQINAEKDIYLVGGNVALKSGTIQAGEDVNLVAVRDFATNGNSAAAGKDHVIYLDGAKIKGKDVTTLSGKVQMVNAAEIEGTRDASLYIGNSFTKTADEKIITNATKENTLDMRASKVTAPEVGLSAGGAGIFEGSTVAGTTKLKDTELHVPSGSDFVGKIDATSRVTSGGLDEAGFERITDPADVPPTPEKPVPPAVPDTIAPAETPLSAQDKENIETGKTKALDALVEPTQEKRAEALTKTVAQLNEKVGTSRRQTAGVVVGIVQEITNAAALSDGEKVALIESVLNAYTPVQEAKASQDNTATDTLDEAVSAATNVSVAPVYPDETEAEEPVSFTS
jgi:putative filamentous hemagglutinin family protein